MYVYLGNLTIDELEKRTGYKLSNRDRAWLEDHRQDIADVKFDSDKFHIFDIPFCIQCAEPIYKELIELLKKYDDIRASDERLSIVCVTETDEQKKQRLEKEQKEKEAKDRKENPNSIWNLKWHMSVPVQLVDGRQVYYDCFINTYTRGYVNIPKIVTGKGWIKKDLEGLHGKFMLNNPESDSDADEHPDWNYVVGMSFRNTNGNSIGEIRENPFFDRIDFDLADCIKNYETLTGWKSSEIHFYKNGGEKK